jgi:hypothetical protein
MAVDQHHTETGLTPEELRSSSTVSQPLSITLNHSPVARSLIR